MVTLKYSINIVVTITLVMLNNVSCRVLVMFSLTGGQFSLFMVVLCIQSLH